MYPFKNILFTTDFSPNSKSALKYAAAFARKHGSKIYIHNAQEGTLPPQALKISDRALSENGYDWVMAIKKEMEELAASELLDGLSVHLILSEGRPAEEIPRVVRDYNIDLLTMGTTARANIGGGVGSTALGVMSQIVCPVLFTRQSIHDFVYYKGKETNFALNRILFSTDFSKPDDNARNMAIALAQANNAELLLLHCVGSFLSYLRSVSVNDVFDIETRVRSDAQTRLNEIAASATGVKTETLLLEGRPYEEVLRLAVDRDIDLIIMGSGGPKATAGKLPGRNAERIVRGAPCPVMSVLTASD